MQKPDASDEENVAREREEQPQALAETIADPLALAETLVDERGLESTQAAPPQAAPMAPPDLRGDVTIKEPPGHKGQEVVAGEQVERGAKLGRFTVLDRLGEGGMGLVVAAYDPLLDRKVAIKLVRPSLIGTGADNQTRLMREAKAMARLSHPNVVTVHDVGVFFRDVFIAMEFIDGRTLRDWVEEEVRSPRSIVDVFVQAGQGLVAAHKAGLVHRDFKPENVLVAKDGRVVVTDFGIAKIGRGAPGSERKGPASFSRDRPPSSRFTVPGTVLGTPVYMSPEQYEGKDADARSDQFSFCVALYEALYGARPFTGKSYQELRDNVAQGKLAPTPEGKSVPAWLRAAILPGLQPDPAERYPSMALLLEALGREPGVVWRRRATLVAIAAAAALGVVGLLRGTSSRANPCAGVERELAGVWDDGKKSAVRTAFEATRRPYATDTYERLERLLDDRARSWSAMRTEACEATHVRSTQSAQLFDLRMQCLDRRRNELRALTALFGDNPDPDVLDESVQAAHQLAPVDACADVPALMAAIPPPEDAHLRTRVDALRLRVNDADALRISGKPGVALPIASDAVREAQTMPYAPIQAEALLMLGNLQHDAGDHKTAETTLIQAAQAAARAKDDLRLAKSWIHLEAVLGIDQARVAEALMLRPVAESAIERSGNDPRERVHHMKNVCDILRVQGKVGDARVACESALSICKESLASEDLLAAEVLTSLGAVFTLQGENAQAHDAFTRSLVLLEGAIGSDHPKVAEALRRFGDTLFKQGRNDDAMRMLERAAKISRASLGPEHPQLANVLNNMGNVLSRQGKYDEAFRTHEQALSIREKALGPEHHEVGTSLNNMGICVDAQGKPAEAEKYYLRALAVREKALGPDHIAVARTLANLGETISAQGRLDQARGYLERAVTIYEKSVGANSPVTAYALLSLASHHLDAKRPAEALGVFNRVLAILEPREAEEDPTEIAFARFGLAQALWEAGGDRARAITLAKRARAAYETAGAGHKSTLDEVKAWIEAREQR